jgi:ABC-2 type transport system ATP-binding protein
MSHPGLFVDGVTIDRGGRRILTDVAFDVRQGEIVAVVGPNGAGKTSLLEAVLGFLPGMRGQVAFAGRPIRGLHASARVFSCLLDDAQPPAEVRVATLIAHATRFGRPPLGLAVDLADNLDLERLARRRVGTLSRGERRRVALFGALCTSRPVVVLDEPLGTFDPLQLIEVLGALRRRAQNGTALLLSVHQLADAEKIAGRVLVLDGGRSLAFATLAELRSRMAAPAASLEDVFLALLRAVGDDARS